MMMTVSEKIRLMLGRRGVTITALAKSLGISRQYLNTKLKNNSFNVDELKRIANILNYDFDAVFTSKDGTEII